MKFKFDLEPNLGGNWLFSCGFFHFPPAMGGKIPEYKDRGFYLAGESYAGYYIPQLAGLLVRNNATTLNLRGILMGIPTLEIQNLKGRARISKQ
ncbi:hypothetical protein Mapa_012596 [Marchantia paleacea]|nr:hypothetical protein Mapa_012596 [Marchantia paleacea]